MQNEFRDALAPDLRLSGKFAALEPMQLSHIDELNNAAADGQLWNLSVATVPNSNGMQAYVEHAIKQRERGLELPFVVRRLVDMRIVGSTRFYLISKKHRNLSIGHTWYAESAQRTEINTQCKFLLLRHAFEHAGCIGVQFHTHHNNTRSQAAIQRLGARFEGVLRNHMICQDGSIRHTHCFSITE